MNIKPVALAALATSFAFSGLAYAESENMGFKVNGNIALTTDYRYRGISQSDRGPAVQGGLDIGHETGLYAGIWASSVDFGFTDVSAELDYYAGFAGKIVDKVGFDVGYIYYDYPMSSFWDGELDFSEIYGSLSFAGATLGVAYSPEFPFHDESVYVYLDYAAAIPAGFTLGLHFGYSDVSGKDVGGFEYVNDGTYTDYSISLSREFMGVNFGLAWVDTDIDEKDCPSDLNNPTKLCDDAFVFTVSKTN